jgi:hypothetical protein
MDLDNSWHELLRLHGHSIRDGSSGAMGLFSRSLKCMTE